MSEFVLNASVAANWLLDDELDPRAEAASERISRDEAFVPQLWHLEVRNALATAERRGRIDASGFGERIRALLMLPVSTDTAPDLDAALALARAHELSFYDAIYLELAQRREAALATLDTALRRAAAAEGLSLVR